MRSQNPISASQHTEHMFCKASRKHGTRQGSPKAAAASGTAASSSAGARTAAEVGSPTSPVSPAASPAAASSSLHPTVIEPQEAMRSRSQVKRELVQAMVEFENLKRAKRAGGQGGAGGGGQL